jgi:hypothetical protein
MAKSLDILPVEGFLLQGEQFVGAHPLGRSIRGATYDWQATGLDVDPWFGGLGFCLLFLSCKTSFQQIGSHVLELPSLVDGPDFHRPHEIGRKIEGGFHAGSLLVSQPTVKFRDIAQAD